MRKSRFLKLLAVAGFWLGWVASAQALDIGPWTCTGTCGTLGADGVVPLSPVAGGASYGWISTNGSTETGLAPPSITAVTGADATNGSTIVSPSFTASSGQVLSFYFDYVTSDGSSSYGDFAWVRLLNASTGAEVAILFTARTSPTGDTVPGYSMPPLPTGATLIPASTPVFPGGPSWTPLGANSGQCFSDGCGYTGWVQANYVIPAAGTYKLEFGVVNWDDMSYNSGLAFDGAMIGGTSIGLNQTGAPIPTLGQWAQMALALALLCLGLAGLRGNARR